MASRFEKGKSIFFLFRGGYTVQDSQLKPRYYLTKNKAKEFAVCDNDEVVEYAPVAHGRWMYLGENSTGKIFACSACRFPHNPNKRDVALIRAEENPSYCPKCGAKMDGGKSDASD